ncbi:MAG: pantoate--beta-alanine ligase [Actinobacteria bacterium]|nr:MAG: pantoate--beta-alanine ligase [Actinomycetota bacterium]
MKIVGTVDELRDLLRPARRSERTIGLVPTMGALHEGHLSLIRQAREQCEVVVMSLFVNPAQFEEPADLDAYPRDHARDGELAAGVGVDYLFAPGVEEVYPQGFTSRVSVSGVTEPLEGQHRGTAHFEGVTTVVAKLFNMVQPDVAYFGQKDAQQAVVIRRLALDLDFAVRIEICPTVREPDGLAMSSRNERLSPSDRRRATALHRALRAAAEAIASDERTTGTVIAAAMAELENVELDYFELVNPDTLAPVGERIDGGEVLAVVAARVGATRLIDNQSIQVPSTSDGEQAGSAKQEVLHCSARC